MRPKDIKDLTDDGIRWALICACLRHTEMILVKFPKTLWNMSNKTLISLLERWEKIAMCCPSKYVRTEMYLEQLQYWHAKD